MKPQAPYRQAARKNNMKRNSSTKNSELLQRREAPLATPTDLARAATKDIAGAMNAILADVFALYLKTKNFHWHMSGSHFRDYHLMLDDQGDQIFSMTDAIAERARKLGGTTVRSIGQISRLQRIVDNDAEYVKPLDMIAELRDDNAVLTQNMREVHSLCDEAGDVATASLLENWIDEAEKRTWFLFECGRHAGTQNERYATEDSSRRYLAILLIDGWTRSPRVPTATFPSE